MVVMKIYAAAKRAPNGGRPNGFARKASDAIATVASWAIASYCNVALAVSYAVLIAFAIVVSHGAARRLTRRNQIGGRVRGAPSRTSGN